jgi:hypothetical protein
MELMKTKPLTILLCLTFSTFVFAGWTPPTKPDPRTIINEAYADTAAGRFEDSLVKHVWFHENVLKIDEGFYGVRLSYALADWVKLGKKYPPAFEKLRSIRDQNEADIRAARLAGRFPIFSDYEAINEYLNEETKTKDLFVWLDAQKPKLAKELYGQAQTALIKAKEYKLCGKYIESDSAYDAILKSDKLTRDVAKTYAAKKRRSELDSFADRKFTFNTTTLIALLTINDRKSEADSIAAKAKKENVTAKFAGQVEQALQGKVPEPWP